MQFNVGQQGILGAVKANCILDCISKSMASRSKGVIFSLYSAFMGQHLESCAVLGARKTTAKAWVLLRFYPGFDASDAFAFSTVTWNYLLRSDSRSSSFFLFWWWGICKGGVSVSVFWHVNNNFAPWTILHYESHGLFYTVNPISITPVLRMTQFFLCLTLIFSCIGGTHQLWVQYITFSHLNFWSKNDPWQNSQWLPSCLTSPLPRLHFSQLTVPLLIPFTSPTVVFNELMLFTKMHLMRSDAFSLLRNPISWGCSAEIYSAENTWCVLFHILAHLFVLKTLHNTEIRSYSPGWLFFLFFLLWTVTLCLLFSVFTVESQTEKTPEFLLFHLGFMCHFSEFGEE